MHRIRLPSPLTLAFVLLLGPWCLPLFLGLQESSIERADVLFIFTMLLFRTCEHFIE